jgi:hypothetical protein
MKTIFYSDVDRLGLLLAQIADLTKQANNIKKAIKEMPYETYEGNLFRAVVIEQERVSYDTDVLKAAADQAVLDLAKRESFVVSVKVTARAAD